MSGKQPPPLTWDEFQQAFLPASDTAATNGPLSTIRITDGLVREVEFLEPLNMAILSERRVYAPYGLEGGEPGKRGKNIFIHKDGRKLYLGAKNEILARPGDRFRILTPGGGGFGKKAADS